MVSDARLYGTALWILCIRSGKRAVSCRLNKNAWGCRVRRYFFAWMGMGLGLALAGFAFFHANASSIVTTPTASPAVASEPRFEAVQPDLFGVSGGQPNCWADVNNDGNMDLFVGMKGNAPNKLYLNNGDGTFKEVAAQVGIADTTDTRAAGWGDFDGDGNMDLYVGFSEAVRRAEQAVPQRAATASTLRKSAIRWALTSQVSKPGRSYGSITTTTARSICLWHSGTAPTCFSITRAIIFETWPKKWASMIRAGRWVRSGSTTTRMAAAGPVRRQSGRGQKRPLAQRRNEVHRCGGRTRNGRNRARPDRQQRAECD